MVIYYTVKRMKKVFSLALLFVSVNNFFADGDISNEPVAESRNIVSGEQQDSSDACKRFFLELGVDLGTKTTKVYSAIANLKFNYRFSFGGTVAPYYVINDKYSIGLELGVDRTESAKHDDGDTKFNITNFSYLLMLKRNVCQNMYFKVGAGLANGTLFAKGSATYTNSARMGFAARAALGYNIWKNVDLELGYKYYKLNAKEDLNNKIKSGVFSVGFLVRL